MSAISYISVGFGRVWEFLDLVIFAASMAGLYAFAWNRRMLSAEFWKSFFISFVIWNIYYLYFVPLPEKVSEATDMSQAVHVTVNSIPFIPLYIALYRYAFRRDFIWKDMP